MSLGLFISISALLIVQSEAQQDRYSEIKMIPNVEEQVIEAGSNLTLACTTDDESIRNLSQTDRLRIEITWKLPAITQYQEVKNIINPTEIAHKLNDFNFM